MRPRMVSKKLLMWATLGFKHSDEQTFSFNKSKRSKLEV